MRVGGEGNKMMHKYQVGDVGIMGLLVFQQYKGYKLTKEWCISTTEKLVKYVKTSLSLTLHYHAGLKIIQGNAKTHVLVSKQFG